MKEISNRGCFTVVIIVLLALLLQACNPGISQGNLSSHASSQPQKAETAQKRMSSPVQESSPRSAVAPQEASTIGDTSSLTQKNSSAWVLRSQPYVKVTNYVATIDPQIYTHLDPESVDQVMQSVRQYNMLDLAKRQVDVKISYNATQSTKPRNAPTCESASASFNWWGVTIHLNHCLVNDIVFGGTGTSVIVSAILAAADLEAAIPVVVGGVTLLASALSWADDHCGNHGANLNVSWVLAFWVAPIC